MQCKDTYPKMQRKDATSRCWPNMQHQDVDPICSTEMLTQYAAPTCITNMQHADATPRHNTKIAIIDYILNEFHKLHMQHIFLPVCQHCGCQCQVPGFYCSMGDSCVAGYTYLGPARQGLMQVASATCLSFVITDLYQTFSTSSVRCLILTFAS